eukprot:2650-Heterococcus_DN1.PRE.1
MKRVLRLWMAYNQWAVQQSEDLCRVVTSNKRIVKDPVGEANRLIEALRSKCGVPVPRLLTNELVKGFVDVSMQHRAAIAEMELTATATAAAAGQECVIPEPTWELPTVPRLRAAELQAYTEAMQLHCDLDSGAAFVHGYVWPPVRQT